MVRHTPPPEGYFDAFTEEVMAQIKLDQIMPDHNEVIPPAYFEQLPMWFLPRYTEPLPEAGWSLCATFAGWQLQLCGILVAVVMLKYVMPTGLGRCSQGCLYGS